MLFSYWLDTLFHKMICDGSSFCKQGTRIRLFDETTQRDLIQNVRQYYLRNHNDQLHSIAQNIFIIKSRLRSFVHYTNIIIIIKIILVAYIVTVRGKRRRY